MTSAVPKIPLSGPSPIPSILFSTTITAPRAISEIVSAAHRAAGLSGSSPSSMHFASSACAFVPSDASFVSFSDETKHGHMAHAVYFDGDSS